MPTRKYKFRLFSICCVLLCTYNAQADYQTNAPTHQRTNEPARIISLKPNITEILFALGAGDKVVGVTTWCDYPPEVKALPKVADYININTEKIIALRPDIVIGSMENSIKQQFDVLHSAEIKTLTLPFTTLDQMYSSIEKIADTTNLHKKGNELIEKIKSDLGTYALRHLRTALILVGHRPLVAASDLTFYGDAIKLLGWKNIVQTKAIPYPIINTEFILAKNPDIIIDLAMGSEEKSELPEAIGEKVVPFNMSDFRAGPRIGEALKKLLWVMGDGS